MIARVIDETSVVPVLVGGSYGAWVCLQLAARHPGAARGMIVFEPPLFAAGAASAAVLEPYRNLLDERRYAAAARLFAARVARMPEPLLDGAGLTGAEPPSPPGAERKHAAHLADACLRDLEAMANDVPDAERWSSITSPALLVQGELTWEPMPGTMDDLAAALRGSHVTRKILDGQLHFAPHTAPAAFAAAVATFTRALPTGPAAPIFAVSDDDASRDAAALIWADATARRDSSPDTATLAQARPVIDSALTDPEAVLVTVRDQQDRILGFAALAPIEPGAAEVHYFAVTPASWRGGVGRSLLAALPALSDTRGWTRLGLSVYADNHAAVAAYERAGWRRNGPTTPHPRSGRPQQRYELVWASN